MLLGLAACGGGRRRQEGQQLVGMPTQDPNVKFTGDPVTVMTISTYDTDTLNAKAVLDIAQGAVVQINNAGGLGGHELKLITCNDSADPNKAADCARQAVDEGVAALVGGFTANGDAIMPILEQAGIPWFGPPGISSAELSSEDSYPITSGVLGLAGLGQMAAEDGCDKVASVNYDLPSAGQIAQLVDLALTNAGHDKSTLIKVPADDHRLQHHRAGDQRLRLRRGRYRRRSRSSASPPPAPSSAARRSTTSSPAGSPTPWPRAVARRSRAPSPCRTSPTSTTRSGTRPRSTSATWPTRRTAAGPRSTSRTPGSAYRTFLSLIKNNDDFSAAGVKATLDATTQVDTDGFAPPFSFAEDFPAPGLNRVVQLLQELTFEIKDGKLQQDGTEYTDMRARARPRLVD